MSSISQPTPESRPLDGAEAFADDVQKLGYSDICSSITIRSSCILSRDLLQKSLEKVVQRQPLLRARIIQKNDGQKWFEIGQAGEINVTHLDKDESDLADVIEQLFSTVKYDVNDQYRWKVFRLRQKFDFVTKSYLNVLVFHCSHAIADGRSMQVFLREVVSNLNTIGDTDFGEVSRFPLLPSNAILLGNHVNWPRWQTWLMLPHMYSLIIRATLTIQSLQSFTNPVLRRLQSLVQGTGTAETKVQPGTRVLLRNIPSHTVAKLSKKCRSQGSTVTGALSAACHIAFCELLSAEEHLRSASNDITIAVSSRPLHSPKIPSDYIGNFVGSLNYNLPMSRGREEFWDLARLLSTMIQEDVRRAKHIQFVSGLEAARKAIFEQIVREASLDISERRSSGHAFSSIGKFDWPSREDDVFKMENLYIVAASHRMFPTFVNFAVTINDKLNWTISFDRSVISREIAQRYSDCAWEIVAASL